MNPRGRVNGIFRLALRKNRGEFFTADASGGIHGSKAGFQLRGKRLDSFIPGAVTVGVIDVFEVIDVNDDEAASPPGPKAAFDLPGQNRVKKGRIHEPR